MIETHTFSVAAAKEIGIKEALILGHIEHWCRENALRGRHFHDGRYWTYASSGYLAKKYPYIPLSTVKRVTAKLEDRGLIVTGSYNSDPRDRTTWYSVTDEGMRVLGAGMDDLERETSERRAGGDGPEERVGGSDGDERAKAVAALTEEVVTYLNERAGKRFRTNVAKTRGLVSARMREGFGADDFRAVIDRKVADWGGDPRMCKFLRPETLFGTKFEGYLNEGGGSRGRYDQFNS